MVNVHGINGTSVRLHAIHALTFLWMVPAGCYKNSSKHPP
jgi:hypothetical protein